MTPDEDPPKSGVAGGIDDRTTTHATDPEQCPTESLAAPSSLVLASVVGTVALVVGTVAGGIVLGRIAAAAVPFCAGLLSGYLLDDGIGLSVLAGITVGLLGTVFVVGAVLLVVDEVYYFLTSGFVVELIVIYPLYGVVATTAGSVVGNLFRHLSSA